MRELPELQIPPYLARPGPHGLHWLHVLEVERVRDSDVVVGMVVVVGFLPRLLLSAPSAHQLQQVAVSTQRLHLAELLHLA